MPSTSTLAQRLPESDPFPQPTAAPLARPKVMRRPAQFSEASRPAASPAAASAPASTVLADAPLPAHPAAFAPPALLAHPPRGWQDDARFGVVMLAIVLVINLALMLWLPRLAPVSTATGSELTTQVTPEVKPADGLTFYYSPPAASALPPRGATVHILGNAGESSQ